MRKLKKRPVQIYLDPNQDRVLTMLARSSGKSKAGIIRSCIDRFLASLPADQDPLLDIVGLGSSNKGDVAARHDQYLTSSRK
ncbi:MAG: hypothetical protein JRJ12_10985 [Deltaproteobacteria bacterium]|nr:hypothetical protein [Deltaproteobacteria bacterium]MBW2071333.1 hypothetical protein [Deltaproteobacteria bacterium]